MRKPRIDSVLFQLSEDQQTQIYDWLLTIGYERTRERIALDPPHGFGIQTYLCSLRRFLVRYSASLHQADPLDDLREFGEDTPDAAENAVRLAAFELASNPANPKSFAQLSRWLDRKKNAALKEKYLQLAREQLALSRERVAISRAHFEFNAARQALIHSAKLREIRNNDETYDREKIDLARAALFGIPVDKLPK